MKISNRGVEFIKKEEGCVLTAYKCPAGVWTIGYGSTGSHVHKGLRISEPAAEELLRTDLRRFEDAVNTKVRVPLNQAQYDALVSFTFNVGVGAFSKSTLLRKLNTGDYTSVRSELARWNRGGGRVLRGLTLRRQREAELFYSKDDTPDDPPPETKKTPWWKRLLKK